MLFNKKYDSGDIVAFKVVNGDEIVAKIVDDNATEFVVDKPCTVIPSQQGIGLVQSLFTADQKNNISISKTHVIMHSKVIDQMEKHYIQTTTGIQPVTKGSIVI
jgi:hypothetical protein